MNYEHTVEAGNLVQTSIESAFYTSCSDPYFIDVAIDLLQHHSPVCWTMGMLEKCMNLLKDKNNKRLQDQLTSVISEFDFKTVSFDKWSEHFELCKQAHNLGMFHTSFLYHNVSNILFVGQWYPDILTYFLHVRYSINLNEVVKQCLITENDFCFKTLITFYKNNANIEEIQHAYVVALSSLPSTKVSNIIKEYNIVFQEFIGKYKQQICDILIDNRCLGPHHIVLNYLNLH